MKSLSGISNAHHAEYVKPSCKIASPDPSIPYDSCRLSPLSAERIEHIGDALIRVLEAGS
jgi:hypothetical protein